MSAVKLPKRPPAALLAVAAVLIAGIGFGLWRWSRFNDLHVVNGLPVAVEVTLDGNKSQHVAATTGRVKFEGVGAGTHVVEVKHDGRELETTLVFVKGGSHELVYNIGGAAPLLWEKIAYSTYSAGKEPVWSMYCGQKFIVLDDVDYVFTEPPKSVSVKGGGTVYRTHLELEGGGLKSCYAWVVDRGSTESWVELQRLEAKLDPSKVIDAIDLIAMQGDLREAQLLAEQAIEKSPTFDLLYTHELLLLASGQTEKARARYAREANDASATDTELYLASVLLTPAERLPFLEVALTRFPDSGALHLAKARAHDRLGDDVKALAEYTAALRTLPGGSLARAANGQLSTLLRLKRNADAWSALTSLVGRPTDTESAITYVNVARLTGNSSTGWDAQLKPPSQRWAQARLDLPVTPPKTGRQEKDWDSPPYRKARELIALTLNPGPGGKTPTPAPLGALAAVARAGEPELKVLPKEYVWLLLTEAWRTGDSVAATKLSRHAGGYDLPRFDDARELISTGRVSPRLDFAPDPLLAVLWLARGRRLATLGDDPKDAYAQVRRFDALGLLPARALDKWPAATPMSRLAFVPVP
ncbi:MAG: hypothetical protein JNK82_13105 [Myxococcaceae bacterium]|nr:hypothetical protein [Myxococcaceae bacterium]